MNKTSIEWTNWSATPLKMQLPDGTRINSCVHLTRGCAACYAEAITRRFWKKQWGEFPGYTPALLKIGTPVLVGEELNAVLRLSDRITKGKADPEENKIFWNDMTDEYLDFWPDETLDKIWAVRALTPNLIHQVLTKRAERMQKYCYRLEQCDTYLRDAAIALRPQRDYRDVAREVFNRGAIPRNIHLGVSAEDQKTADERIPWLLKTPAAVRFVSYEPALAAIDIRVYLDKQQRFGMRQDDPCVDQVIVGGESGPGARPMDPAWARSVRDQCVAAGVAFFFKQWGAWQPWTDAVNSICGLDQINDPRMVRVGKKRAGRILDGREWNGFPAAFGN